METGKETEKSIVGHPGAKSTEPIGLSVGVLAEVRMQRNAFNAADLTPVGFECDIGDSYVTRKTRYTTSDGSVHWLQSMTLRVK
jgi:hypothetical protein